MPNPTIEINVNNPYAYTAPVVPTDSNSVFNGQFYSAGSMFYIEFTGPNANKITYDFAAVEAAGEWGNDVNDWITPDAGFSGDVGITLHIWDALTSTTDSSSGTVTVSDAGGEPVDPVPDTEKPVITLIGSANIVIGLGSVYTDQGANVSDNVDADAVLVAQGAVDTNTVNVYTLTYNYTDTAGNVADTVYRTVEVVDVKPVIVLNGSTSINHIINTTYTDLGAVATDDVDLDSAITGVGSVNTALEGVYTITYDHTDSDSNVADTVYRSVNVFDPDASTGSGADAVLGSVLS